MANITSLGVGSGLDLQNLVDGLIAAEGQATTLRLDSQEAKANEKLSAYGLLKSSVSLFNDALSNLGNVSTFRARTATSSDETAVTISASDNAAIGSYQVDVVSAGAAQQLQGSSFVDVTNTAVTSADIAIGGGTLTIQQGGQPAFSVSIDPAASSLNDIVNAINANDDNTGVQATVLNTDAGPVLIFNASDVGTANTVSITVSDIDGDDTDSIGLSQLQFDPNDVPGSNLSEVTAAADAEIAINGQSVTSSNGRTFANVVEGLSITALDEVTGATVTIGRDTSSAITAVDEFVEQYNALMSSIDDLARGGSEDGSTSAGTLVGDSIIRSLESQLRRAIFSQIDDTQPEGIRSLSDIGLEITREGRLQLSTTRFNDLLASNFDDVARLLAADGNPIPQNQQLRSGNIDDVSTVVGEGQLTITAAGESFTVDISAVNSNDTLQGIRDAINASPDNNSIVTASVILVSDGVGGTDAQLVLTSNTAGAEGSLSVVVDDNDGNDLDASGLSVLATENLIEVNAATLDAPQGVIANLSEQIAGFLGGSGQQGVIDARTEGLSQDLSRIEDERIALDLRLEQFQRRTVAKYAALDGLVASLQASGDFLLNQLETISQINNNRNS